MSRRIHILFAVCVAVAGFWVGLGAGDSAPAGIADLVVTITGGPPSSTRATEATFSWKVNARGVAETRCRLDAGALERCGSPKSYSDLAIGSHRFLVRAYDAADRQIGSDA